MPFSRNSKHPQYLSSRTGTRSSTRLVPSASIATPAPLASEPPSNRMAPYAPSSSSAEPPSTMSRIGPLWSSKPDASRGVFGVYFLVFTDHQGLQQICKIGKTKPRIQRWMEFLSAYNFHLSYRRGQANADADFLSHLPLPPIDEHISGASALTDLDDLGVYLIRACGFTTLACPVPGVGLGGLTPSPCHAPDAVLGWPTPPPNSPVLGGLYLTIDDFRTHRAPMPSTHMTARPRRLYATPPPTAPFTTYAISALDDAPRRTRRTRSQTAILDDNTPSRPDYRTAAHSGFAASAASAPPPLRTSPPPRSARLGSTTSTGRLASTSSMPTPPDLQSDPPPPTAPLHPTAPDLDVKAAAAHLSNTLLNYSHSDWEQAQREYCLSLTTSQLPPDQMVSLSVLDGLLSTTPFASMCPFWPDRGSCMHATAMPPVTSVLCAPSKCLNASTGGLVWKPARNGGCAAA